MLLQRLDAACHLKPKSASEISITTDQGIEVGTLRATREGKYRASVAELTLAPLLTASLGSRFKPIPKYPPVLRDVSVVVARTVKTGDLLETIEGASGWLKDGPQVVDFYEGKGIGEGNVSITFRLPFRSDERTLTDAEADAELANIVAALKTKFSAAVR